ncbi:MAG: DNA polymerase I [Spirochaetia bacterium]|nr:DNA polymerase I [Spirochaetia bacterium]
MATFSRLCSEEKKKCRIITGDKDLMQLVDDYTKVLRPDKTGYEELGSDEVFTHYGVYPNQIKDYLSLTGDSADNIPGVRGIGPKNAASLLLKYGSLEGIYSNIEEIKGSAKTKLEEGKENCLLSRELVALRNDVALDSLPEDFLLDKIDFAGAVPLFEAENAKSLVSWAAQKAGIADAGTDTDAGEATAESGDSGESRDSAAAASKDASRDSGAGASGDAGDGPAGVQAGLSSDSGLNKRLPNQQKAFSLSDYFNPDEEAVLKEKGSYTSVTDIRSLDNLMEQIKKKKIFSFDIETDSLDTLKANPVGFSVSTESGCGFYIPLVAEGKEILPETIVKNRLRAILEDKTLKLIGQNIKYDYKVLRKWGIKPLNIWFDTMIASWLLNSRLTSNGMDYLAEYYLEYTTIHFKDMVPEGSTFAQVPLDKATGYAAEDADITYRLYRVFNRQIEKRKMGKLFFDLEMPLVMILSEMELEGVRIRRDVLETYGKELGVSIGSLESEIHLLCGKVFNVSSPKQLQEVLFTDRQLKPGKKTKTGYSTDNSVLEELSGKDPVPALVLKYRALSKLKSTYVDALPLLAEQSTSKIHTTYRQTGTATGRLSSINPNLQNIPIKDEEGRKIRKAFIPSAGRVFMSADYSQIELVVLAHLSEDPELLRAFKEKIDVHTLTASLIFDISAEDVTPEQRRIAKTINFGVMYGMSGFRLARELQIPRSRADEFIKSYFQRYSSIRQFIDSTVKFAEENGFVKTILGRERYIDGINNSNKNVKSGAERIAVNTPIQGSAADIVKLAMIRINSRMDKEKLKASLVLQVHDELIFEVPFNEIDKMKTLLKDEMESVMKLKAPLRVSIETGESWGEMH